MFAKYKISFNTERLMFDLVHVLFEMLRGPGERLEKSLIEQHFPTNYREAFLQRLEVILEDPAFVSHAELNPRILEEKRNRAISRRQMKYC